MTTGSFTATAQLDLADHLSPKLNDAAKLVDTIDGKLAALATKSMMLDPNGGFAKLVGDLNPKHLIGELNKVEAKVTEFKGVMKEIAAASEQLAADGVKFMTPLNDAVERAKLDAKELGEALAKAPGGGARAEERKPLIDRFGTALTTIQQRLGYIETALKPAEVVISESAALQSALIRFQINTGASKYDMEALRKVVETTRQDTQLSPLDEAKLLEVIADRVGPKPADSAKILPIYSNFADAQMLMKGTSYEQSADSLATLTRQAGITDLAEIGAYADLLNRASLLVHDDTATFTQAVKASAPAMKNDLGMSNQDILLANVMANWFGASGEGGAKALASALTSAVAGASSSGPGDKSGEALKQIGILDESGHTTVLDGGRLDFQKFLQRLGAFENKAFKDSPNDEAAARQKIAATLRTAFGKDDQLVAGLVNPELIDQMRRAEQHLGDFTVKDVQKRFNDDSVQRQLATAKANADTALVEIGTQTLPTVNETLKGFNALLSWTNGYLRRDPEFAKELGFVTLGASGLLGGLGLGGLFRGISGGLFGLAEGAPGAASALPKMAAGEAGIMDEALAWIGLGADATAVGAAPELAAGAAAAPEAAGGLTALLFSPIGWAVLAGGTALGGKEFLDRRYENEHPELQNQGYLSWLNQEMNEGGIVSNPALWGFAAMNAWRRMDRNKTAPAPTNGAAAASPSADITATMPGFVDPFAIPLAAQPGGEALTAGPTVGTPAMPAAPISFTMPSDRRGPTVERAAALSHADTPAKQQSVNVQVQPGQVIVQLDGHAIATAVMEFIARQVGGPNTGPVSHDPFQNLTPAGSHLSYLT